MRNIPNNIRMAKIYSLRLGYLSARIKLRALTSPLPLQQYLGKIDETAIESIRQRYYESPNFENNGENLKNSNLSSSTVGRKYLNMRKYLPENVKRAQALNLDRLPPQRILDLGSGAGYFLFICRQLGHKCLGLDTDDVPAYKAMMKLLEVPRLTWRIEPFVPLPAMGARFDLITAYQMSFTRGDSENRWGPAQWDFFLNDLRGHINPDGRIFLRFNKDKNKNYYISKELSAFFRSRGAQVGHTSVHFDLKNCDSALCAAS